MNLKELKRKSLSGNDILSNARTNLMTFRDIKNATSLNEILGPYKSCVILYENKDGSGHWCVIFEVNKDLVEFFDPYGYMIDSQLKYISDSYKKKTGLVHTFLINLILKSNYKYIEYNNYPLQELKNGINTCGRHVLTRLFNRRLKLDDYYDKIKKSGMNGDDYVTNETYFIN